MPKPEDLSEQERMRRIKQLKQEISRKSGDPENVWMSDSLNPEIQEQFLKRVLAVEAMEERPLFDLLRNKGIELPPAAQLDDTQLSAKLWEVIIAMARVRHYLSRTDHLSDRALYELLWTDILRQPTLIDPDPNAACHIDILGGCSDEDIKTNLKYYADEEERLDWADEYSEEEMPPHEPLPFDRDRHLPGSPFSGNPDAD